MIDPAMSSSKLIATWTIISCTINVPVLWLKVEVAFQPQISRHLQRLDPWYISVGNILWSHFASGLIFKRTTFLMNRFSEARATTIGRRHPCRSQHRRWFTVGRTISGIVEILRLILWVLVDLYGKLRARWWGHLWTVGATYLNIRLRDLRSFAWKILRVVSYVILHGVLYSTYVLF